jgi:hypothetical protein
MTGHRQPPATPDGEVPEEEAEEGPGDRADGAREVQQAGGHDHRCAGQRGGRVQLAAENRGDLRHEHVAQHAPADAGQDAEQDRRDGVEPGRQRLQRTRDREEREPGGIEHQHRAAQPVDDREPEKGDETRRERDADVPPVADRRRRRGAEEDVAGEAADVARRERQHQHAEDIEPVLDARHRPAQSEDERAGQVEHDEEGADQDRVVTNGHGSTGG